jgi:hypothetical protein
MPRIAVVALVTVVALIVLWVRYPDLHDRGYGVFADDRAGFGMRNVVSNAGFLIVGLTGVVWAMRRRAQLGDDYAAALTLFTGVTFTAFGSAWFHLEPLRGGALNREGLLLDRLPMTIAFAALLALVFRDRVLHRHHRWLLPLMLATGVATLVYWYACDRLLPYAFFQGYVAVGTLLMLAVLPPAYTGARWVAAAVLFFGVAKICEALDTRIFELCRFGGHPLKHVAGAVAALMILLWLCFRRHLISSSDGPLRP